MAKQPYTHESVQRALLHHEQTGAIHNGSPPIAPGEKYRVTLRGGMDRMEFTLKEAYAFCVGLAAGEQRWKQEQPEGKEQHG